MLRFLLRRIGQAVAVVAGVILLTFVIQRVIPGDPAVAAVGPKASLEQLAQARHDFGLDQSLPIQLWNYAVGLLHGDLGTSLHTHQAVRHDLGAAFPASLELVGAGIVLAALIGVPAGVLAARYRRRSADAAIRVNSMLAVSVPTFWFALVLQELFATKLGWFPVAGEYTSSLDQTSPLHIYTNMTLLDSLITGNWPIFTSLIDHLVLPVIVVAAYPAGVIAQLTRAALIEEITQDHTRMERSLGFSERSVLLRFSMRPALNPVLSVAALVFAYSIVNTFLVESVFNWPGLGSYAVDAIRSSDTPAIAGVTLLVASTYVVLNLLVDLVQSMVDPRVRLS
ncbi:MAG: peptide/nickel transport system permease protein [Pseudonocardiales bacterium]|nr:peptide/nickel transport system permease protein [Pseudonocardiales bacterium]